MKWIAVVICAGLFAAGPFLSRHALGTSEATNYSLSTADAVTQVRAGHFPVLAGQTHFAFNGRVHPLRTAPYKDYCAILLDQLTLRRLGFWSLQNLSLACSLVGGALAAFWGLRRVTPASPELAAALAALYVLSPAVLAAAYGMDLYMTVMAVPFVPLVVAANVASFGERKPRVLFLLAAALAASWLAHPPVALWLTLTSAFLQAVSLLLRRPTWREGAAYAGAALLFAVLAGFSFASALSIASTRQLGEQFPAGHLLEEVSRTFPASLRPVSARADQLGDFQLGYAAWGVALAALGLAAGRRHRVALSLLLALALLLVMTTPVPYLHRWLWEHAPGSFLVLTSQWPMQRLYLPATALAVFALALVWRKPELRSQVFRDVLRVVLALAVGWTLWQSWRFVGRGFDTRRSMAATNQSHFAPNVDLTVISYALLGTPKDFVNGVMDPRFECRLLAPFDAHEVASNWTAPLPPSPENRTGVLTAQAGDVANVLDLSPSFTLEPGRSYRLTLKFLQPPADATLQIRGPRLFREYHLPSAGGPRGFGMLPGNNPRLTLWTDGPQPETVSLRLVAGAGQPWREGPVADFAIERVVDEALPVEVQSLDPLRCRVRSPAAGYLETPRMFTSGYAATVNGKPVRVQRSPEGMLMLAVPAGDSLVEVRYPGPGLVRFSFWLAFVGWCGLGAWGASRAGPARLRTAWDDALASRAARIRTRIGSWSRRRWLASVGVVVLAAAAVLAWNRWQDYREAVGPIRIRFVLPRGQTNRQQPLLVTGRPHAGTFVYAVYVDDDHIRIGFDVWSVDAGQTEPIKIDYFADHELVVDSGALYPEGHPALRGRPAAELARTRRHLRIALDGRTVLEREVDPFPSAVRDVTVGRNLIGGSSCEPDFSGRILAVERLPVPAGSR